MRFQNRFESVNAHLKVCTTRMVYIFIVLLIRRVQRRYDDPMKRRSVKRQVSVSASVTVKLCLSCHCNSCVVIAIEHFYLVAATVAIKLLVFILLLQQLLSHFVACLVAASIAIKLCLSCGYSSCYQIMFILLLQQLLSSNVCLVIYAGP